jgi:hypothetical protein
MGRVITDPAEIERLNRGVATAPKAGRPITDPEVIKRLNAEAATAGMTDSSGMPVRVVQGTKAKKYRPGAKVPYLINPIDGGLMGGAGVVPSPDKRRPLTPGSMLNEDQWSQLRGGALPPNASVDPATPTTPSLTEQQQRLAEFARIARAPEGGPNIEAMQSQIGPAPSNPWEDENQAGKVIWQLKNKGGTYKPGYQGTAGEQIKDAYRSLDTGFGQGVALLGGLPGTIQKATPAINQWLNESVAPWLPGKDYTPEQIAEMRAADEKRVSEQFQLPDIGEMTMGMERRRPGSMGYKSASRLGGYANTLGNFIGSGGPGGRTVGAFARNVALPALATRAAEEYTDGNQNAALAAGLSVPLALKLGTSGFGRVLSPYAVADPVRARHAANLRREGVRLSAGDETGSTFLKTAEQELGGGAFQRFKEGQLEDITEATTRRVSQLPPVRRADVAELRAMNAAIDREFTVLGQRNVITPDARFPRALGNVWRRYSTHTNPGAHNRVDAVEDYIVEMVSASRTANADIYQSLRSRLAADARGTADPELRRAYNGLRNAVDDMMERSIQRTNPADLGRYRQVRRDYKNFLTIRDAMSGASEATNLGLVTPAMLQQAAKLKDGRAALAMGRGSFATLARSANALLRDLNNSRTAQRAAVRYGPAAFGTAAGAGLTGYLTGTSENPFGANPIGTAIGGIGGLALGSGIPFALGRGLLSGPGRALLTNRAGIPLRRLGQRMGGWTLPSVMAAGGAINYGFQRGEAGRSYVDPATIDSWKGR